MNAIDDRDERLVPRYSRALVPPRDGYRYDAKRGARVKVPHAPPLLPPKPVGSDDYLPPPPVGWHGLPLRAWAAIAITIGGALAVVAALGLFA